MKNNITRRDFLNGVALGTGASMLAPLELLAQDASAAATNYYPPTLTGLRGFLPSTPAINGPRC